MISRRALIAFAGDHADARTPLDVWYRIAKTAVWNNLVDVQKTFPSAESVGEFTVFNIKGNMYRLITQIYNRQQTMLVWNVLTHANYDKGDWKR